jgi:GntR family transcriptional regulator
MTAVEDLDLRVRQEAPLYRVVERRLRALVEQGAFSEGSKLPPEVELAEMFGVSRNTLREALMNLEQDGLILRKHGVGTFARPAGMAEQGLEALESLDTLGRRQGWQCGTIALELSKEPASGQVASALKLEAETPVVSVRRVKTKDGSRFAYIEDFFPADLVGMDEFESGFEGSVLDFFIARGEPEIDYAWTNIKTIHAGTFLANKLGLPEDEILFLAEETLYSIDSEPFEYSLNYMQMACCRFHIVRTIPSYPEGDE